MTGKGKRFLDPAVLAEALAQIAELATREGVRVALLGGFALQHYGSDRLTGNIDVVAATQIRALPRGTPLSFGGEQTQAPNGVPVDLVLRNDDYAHLYEEALQRAARVRSLPIPVVRPEHLAAMKMVAGRTRAAADLEFLLSSGTVDYAKARTIIKKHLGPYAAQEFDRIVDETTWKASKGRV